MSAEQLRQSLWGARIGTSCETSQTGHCTVARGPAQIAQSRLRRPVSNVAPQRSHTWPRKRMRLNFPQWHSQSFTGPKMRSQKSPSRSGLKDR